MASDVTPMTRRTALAGTAAVLVSARAGFAAGPMRAFFVSTGAKGHGLYPLQLDTQSGTMALGAPNEAILSATFAAYHPRHRLHYLIKAQPDGRLVVYDADWALKADLSSHGDGPCHVALDGSKTWLAVANYNSGSFALYRLDANGMPQEPAVVGKDEGSGTNAERQASAHVHWVGFSPDQRFLYTVDLGNDTVMVAPFDSAKGIGERIAAYKAEPGEGPRHIGFHPNQPLLFLVSELGNSLTALRRAPDGRLSRVSRLSTLPAGFTGHSQAAHIVVTRKGDRIYVSNRGHNSIAVFAVGGDGNLSPLQTIATGGDWPRFFLLLEDAELLIAANQNSGELQLFRVAADGRLARVGTPVIVPDAMFIGARDI